MNIKAKEISIIMMIIILIMILVSILINGIFLLKQNNKIISLIEQIKLNHSFVGGDKYQ